MALDLFRFMFGTLAARALLAVACMLSLPTLASPPFLAAHTAKVAGDIVDVVEFYNAGLEHYFRSADPAEIGILDGGAFGGAWKRTGSTFPAWDVTGAPAGSVPVCRFFGTDRYRANGSRIGPNSHFYTADPTECAFVKIAFQAVASDGVSYPAWTFEANAFAVKLHVGGTCPTGTQALYRTYNNGARGDPNHRYSTNAALLQAMAGWVFEGLVMCLPPGPAATAVGAPTGNATSATIGPAGGTVSTPDGRITVTIPAGALTANTVIGIQPLTNMAHGKIGAAYRLTPEGQAFLQPVVLAFTYTDQDLAGSAVEVLGAAFQSADGLWAWAGSPTVDSTSKTVRVSTSHFSDWSAVKGLQIRPPSKTVLVNGTVSLQVAACYEPEYSEVVRLRYGYECDLDTSLVATGESIAWSVNGVVGGGGITGTVTGNGSGQATATYKAPAFKPSPNTVAVSAQVEQKVKGFLLVSNITIEDTDAWIGTTSYTVIGPVTVGQVVTAQVTWTLDVTQGPGIFVYRPSGTANITGTGCTWAPASGAIARADGVLTLDYNANPPTYLGNGTSSWPATLSCTNPTFSVTAPTVAHFFAGVTTGGAGVLAQGVINPDGKTIEGSSTDGPITYRWKFTRNP